MLPFLGIGTYALPHLDDQAESQTENDIRELLSLIEDLEDQRDMAISATSQTDDF